MRAPLGRPAAVTPVRRGMLDAPRSFKPAGDGEPAAPPPPPPLLPAAAPKSMLRRLQDKPAEVHGWWVELNTVFATDFLLLIAAIYFLQGMGGFPDFVRDLSPKRQLLNLIHRSTLCLPPTAKYLVLETRAPPLPAWPQVMKYYLKNSYATSCEGVEAAGGGGGGGGCHTAGGGGGGGCHAGLALEPAMQSALLATAGLPWNYKIFYGMLSDAVPLRGSHRRAYIALAGLLGVLGFLGLGMLGPPRTVDAPRPPYRIGAPYWRTRPHRPGREASRVPALGLCHQLHAACGLSYLRRGQCQPDCRALATPPDPALLRLH